MWKCLIVASCLITPTGSENLPGSTNGELQKLWKRAMPYKHQAVFQNMQSYGDGWVHPVSWLPGSDRFDSKALAGKRSNPHEFPWVHTAGFANATQKYVYLPEGEHIEYRDRSGRWPDHGDAERLIDWSYPVGTVFVETLTTHGRVFEVRTRTKAGSGWRTNVYRPYADAEELKERLLTLGTRDAKALASAIDKLPRTYLEIKNPHPVKTFEFKGYREDLPDIPESLAETILSWDFVANADWKTDCHAPSTKSDRLSIVAKDYQGCIVRPDSKGCAQCHDTTLGHVSRLEPGRDWYGRVRGSDGIFSFHIFDESTLTVDSDTGKKQVKVNKELPLKRVDKYSATNPSSTNHIDMR